MEFKAGRRVLVVGLARSGSAVAELLLRHGCQVVINELREQPGDVEAVGRLQSLGATCVFGGHPLTLLDDHPDYIVKNPGIPYTVPLIAEAVRRGIPVYTEIEVASWFTSSPIIAITGSNGKTTTTTLVGEILAEAGQQPVVAGNIGTVLSGVVEHVSPAQPIVLEVSSFQLMGTETLRPAVAALLNLYPAHLDYHGSYAAYAEAKWRLFRNMTPDSVAVLNYDCADVRDGATRLRARVVWFSRTRKLSDGVYIDGDRVVCASGEETHDVLPVAEIALKGEHNLENALAAAAVALAAGAGTDAVRRTLARFCGVEHRLEFVRAVGGVEYYNDSKATNPTAALQALRAFDRPLVWIAGGLQRGDDFRVLHDELKRRVKAAVLLGQSAETIAAACSAAGVRRVHHVASIPEAVHVAAQLSEPGDVVLLSPACASWDMFSSFEERGRIFKDAVHRL